MPFLNRKKFNSQLLKIRKIGIMEADNIREFMEVYIKKEFF